MPCDYAYALQPLKASIKNPLGWAYQLNPTTHDPATEIQDSLGSEHESLKETIWGFACLFLNITPGSSRAENIRVAGRFETPAEKGEEFAFSIEI